MIEDDFCKTRRKPQATYSYKDFSCSEGEEDAPAQAPYSNMDVSYPEYETPDIETLPQATHSSMDVRY